MLQYLYCQFILIIILTYIDAPNFTISSILSAEINFFVIFSINFCRIRICCDCRSLKENHHQFVLFFFLNRTKFITLL